MSDRTSSTESPESATAAESTAASDETRDAVASDAAPTEEAAAAEPAADVVEQAAETEPAADAAEAASDESEAAEAESDESASDDASAAASDEAVVETASEEAETEAASEAAPSEEAAEAAPTEEATEATPVEEAAEAAASEEASSEEEAAEAAATEKAAEAAATEEAAEATPVEEAVEAAPSEEASTEEEAAPSEEAAEAAPSEEASSEEAAEAVPSEEASTEEAAPVEETAEAAPTEEAADAAPSEEATEAAPAEEAVEAAPSEEAADAAPSEAAATEGATAEPESAEAAAKKAAEAAAHDAEIGRLRQSMEEKTAVTGRVIGWNKGGYHVAVGRVAAFCPVSQIEIGNPRSPKRYVDKKFDFHILEIQNDGRRVVLSRANALKASRAAKQAEVKERMKPGAVMKGRVSSLTDFGAFVNLGGGIEGLVHVSEISRRRVEHPKEMLETGQDVTVQVLKVEKNGKRISLSMKKLEDDPWKGVAERFASGNEFKGTIVRKADFGLFVELEPGLEGLVHTSRLPIGGSLENEAYQPGNEIEGWVQEVDRKRRRIALSLRQVATGNPWKTVHDNYSEGQVVNGKVERVADFGAFIQLEPGLTGLLPFSVLGSAGNPKRQYHAGREVSVRILSIDTGRKRISLGTEASKAEGSSQDYKEYLKTQKGTPASGGGMNALAAAFAKAKGGATEATD
ncbi:MAG: S1 RNA-binding domain-containing protein [Acidobacteriota bacterium]